LFDDVDHATLGAVVLSGFFNAARLASAASGTPLSEHRILFFGAGSAGIGVAKQLLSFFTLLGMTEEDARNRIYVRVSRLCFLEKLINAFQTVDSKGLITANRKGLQEHKKCE
jgi:malate dehydrogenase (oxaloacetate-decarboxylating)(NADP+)